MCEKCCKSVYLKQKIKNSLHEPKIGCTRVNVIICIVLLTIAIVGIDLLDDRKVISEWENLPHDYVVEEYTMNGYIQESGLYINQIGDAQFQLPELNQYIGYLKIIFDQPLETEMNITVYYAETGQVYSEEYKTYEIVLPGTTELRLPIKRHVSTCRVDIGTEVGQKFDLGSIILNPADSKPEVLEKRTGVIIVMALIALVVLGRTSFAAMDDVPPKPESTKLSQAETLYLLLCFVIYFIWSVSFTNNLSAYGPDEGMRYNIPKFIFENGKLPYGGEEAIRDPNYGFSYGFDINLPYLTSALFMWLTSLFTTDQTALLIAARFTSVLSAVGVSYYTILLSRKLFKNDPLRWAFVVFITMIPQIVFLSSYVNLDSFSLFTAVLIIYAWVCGLETGWKIGSCVRLAIGMGLCFISYKFVYSYILVSFLLYCAWFWINRRQVSYREMFYRGLLIVVIVFLICGWKFIRNAVLYEGNFLGSGESSKYAEMYAIEKLKPAARKMATFQYNGYSIGDMLRESQWISLTCKSFFGLLGWMTIVADDWVYQGYFTFVWIGVTGIIIHCICKVLKEKRLQFKKTNTLLIGAIAMASCITICISLYFSWGTDFQPQGRYIIGALPLVAYLITVGINDWIDLLCGQNEHAKNVTRTILAVEGITFVVLTMLEGYMNCLSILT